MKAPDDYLVCVVVIKKSDLDKYDFRKYWVSTQDTHDNAECVAEQSAHVLTALKNFTALA